MARRNLPTAQPRRGNSVAAKNARWATFAAAYIINGRNGTQAALTAGVPGPGASVWAKRAMKEPAVQAMIDELLATAAPASGLTVEAVLTETARIALNDSRRFFSANGKMIPPVEWTDDMQAAVASVDMEAGVIKFWNKNDALEKAFKHLGLYERDNRQKAENLTLQVLLVQPGQT